MAMLVAGVLFLFCCSVSCYQFKSYRSRPFGDPEQEWRALATIIADERAPVGRTGSKPRTVIPRTPPLPGFLRVPASADSKVLFSPQMGARELQTAVKEILLATPLPATTGSARPLAVESLCHLDRLYVRVSKKLFTSKRSYKYLKLGSCAVNKASNDHYYFLYLLNSPCGFSNKSHPDFFAVNSALDFNPVGPVVWETPFHISLQCQYHRTHHVYSPGIHPKLKGGTIVKKLTSKTSATITLQDVGGKEMPANKPFTVGQPMFFEANLADTKKPVQRLYVDKCYVTASPDPSSAAIFTVIDNQGCMVAGKMMEQAMFIKQSAKISLKFSLSAFMLKEKIVSSATPKIYMHCLLSAGPLTATASAKSCNYVAATKTWKELYDNDAVCACCDSSCLVEARASHKYTSSPLEVDTSLALDSGNVDKFLGYSEPDYWKFG